MGPPPLDVTLRVRDWVGVGASAEPAIEWRAAEASGGAPTERRLVLGGTEVLAGTGRVPLGAGEPFEGVLGRRFVDDPFQFLAFDGRPPLVVRSGTADWLAAAAGQRVGGFEAETPSFVRWPFVGSQASFPQSDVPPVTVAVPAPEGGLWFFGDDGSVVLGHVGSDGELSRSILGAGVSVDRAAAFSDGSLVVSVRETGPDALFLEEPMEGEATQAIVRFDPETLEVLARWTSSHGASFEPVFGGVRAYLQLGTGVASVDGELYSAIDWTPQSFLEVSLPDATTDSPTFEVWPFDRRLHGSIWPPPGSLASIPTERSIGDDLPNPLFARFDSPERATFVVSTDARIVDRWVVGESLFALLRHRASVEVGTERFAPAIYDRESVLLVRIDARSGEVTGGISRPLAGALSSSGRVVGDAIDEDYALIGSWDPYRGTELELVSWAAPNARRVEPTLEGTDCNHRPVAAHPGPLVLEVECDGPHEVRLGDATVAYDSPRSATLFELAVDSGR